MMNNRFRKVVTRVAAGKTVQSINSKIVTGTHSWCRTRCVRRPGSPAKVRSCVGIWCVIVCSPMEMNT
jgi:hypothetical protein